ncbi:MAG: ATP-binding protein [Acetobacteraceae bacterium]
MAQLIAEHDWTATPLGPRETWPKSLDTILRILVTSRYAMWMGWGDDLTFFCNDAYTPTLGVKHPWALGRPANQVWAEIWPDIGPRAESVRQTGKATWDEGLLLYLERSGYTEETYHTFSYSPLPDDDGGVGGMLCVVTEETDRIIGERRLATLRDLASDLASVRTEAQVCDAVAQSLGRNLRDLPFTLTYLYGTGTIARLASTTGAPAADVAPPSLDAAWTNPIWPVDQILRGEKRVLIDDLSRCGDLPHGAWDKPPRLAVAVPIMQAGVARPAGMLVVGVNPYRPCNEDMLSFIELVAAQIAAGLAGARAYEEERQRAETLAEVDRAKTAFFSNVSHEFRTPLTLMLGPLEEEIAARDPADAERLAMVYRNGLRLLRLVNTLLEFSRIEAGRMQARYRPTDLGSLTADLVSNFRSACQRAGLTLQTVSDPLPATAYVDAEMWERIVLNLVSNAFKYTLSGGIVVRLGPAADGREAELVVEDTGVGIPASEVPRIFDRFHRIEGQQGRTHEGTGIGLALVSELVRLHRGTIAVQSEVGKGTAVRVRLPLGRAHLPREQVVEDATDLARTHETATAFVEEALRWLPGGQPVDGSDGVPSGAAGMLNLLDPIWVDVGTSRASVLLVDDNADMRDYAARLLSPHYHVEMARDGMEALSRAHSCKPDLILTDVMMPRLDGFGLLTAIRDDPVLRDVPVIMLSARAGNEAQIDGLNAGADDYLVKPFSSRELLARVRANLETARVRRESEEALREANEGLERRVEEEIHRRMQVEETLRQSMKMEAIGQLTGGVAHDFNNLLTVILGGAETLKRHLNADLLGDRAARVTRAIDMIAEGAQRAATLTSRLLAFARRQTLDPQPVEVNQLITGMSEMLRRTLGERVDVQTVLGGGLWQALIDPNQLENALLNLAVNARDAMPDGGRLTIETANAYIDAEYALQNNDIKPGQYVVVSVADTGSGMPKDVMDRVFEPFFTTKDVGQGTGLGLSQVYGFVKQSDGHVALASEIGKGTVVKLYLPRMIGFAADGSALHYEDADGQGRGETILLVEDDPDVRYHSTEILRELGYQVIETFNGPSALALLDKGTPVQMLFTDIGLPGGLSGRQLAEEARRRRPSLKVLFTTGYAREEIGQSGVLDAGIQLLRKPFRYHDLAMKIRTVLDS